MRRLRGLHGFGSEDGTSLESLPDVDTKSMDDASTSSTDDRSDLTGDRDLSFSYCHDTQLDESASCSDGSSSLGWPLGRRIDRSCAAPSSAASSKMGSGHNTFMWEEKREKRETELSGWKAFFIILLTSLNITAFFYVVFFLYLQFSIVFMVFIFVYERQRWS